MKTTFDLGERISPSEIGELCDIFFKNQKENITFQVYALK